jgi:dynein heavy chain
MPKCVIANVKGFDCFKDNFDNGKKLMQDTGTFLTGLLQFPKENITDEDCELLAPYVDNPLFTVEYALKAHNAAVGMCKWVKAMKTYHEIAKVVIPKMDALRVKEAELAAANKKLAQAQAQLAQAQASLDEMQEKFDKAMADKQKLQDDADNTKRKMDAANALINGLSGEKVRWTQQSKEFDDQIDKLVGDTAIACAFMCYLGPFNKTFRDKLMQKDFAADIMERKLPVTKNLDVSNMLTDSATTGEWNLQGLPTDELSIQNGILTTRASRYPIMVDPQGQGLTWIRNKEASNNVKETSFQDRGFRNALEDCMAFGKPLLLANVENDLDPVLDPGICTICSILKVLQFKLLHTLFFSLRVWFDYFFYSNQCSINHSSRKGKISLWLLQTRSVMSNQTSSYCTLRAASRIRISHLSSPHESP